MHTYIASTKIWAVFFSLNILNDELKFVNQKAFPLPHLLYKCQEMSVWLVIWICRGKNLASYKKFLLIGRFYFAGLFLDMHPLTMNGMTDLNLAKKW